MDRLDALRDWLARVSGPEWSWFAKRLSANDTGLTGSHQVGFYVPQELALAVAPELGADELNPRRRLDFDLVSHDQQSAPGIIYYNNRYHVEGGTRDEFRVTAFGGRRSALQDPENTGAILFTAWRAGSNRVEGWLASTLEEDEAIEAAVGPIEPGTQLLRLAAVGVPPVVVAPTPMTCEPEMTDLPAGWAAAFPTGRELTAEAVRRRPETGEDPDKRLVARYRCEFGLFKVVEAAHIVPLITGGFRTVDEFLGVAQTVANRRKSRAGRSLELHLATVFDEEHVAYETGATTEGNRRPDFLFPSGASYHRGEPTRMLGVKTTVKERWRQVLDEAARIPEKHLFTLSEGVSPAQFAQMDGAGVRLVVPASNIVKFPDAIRPRLLTLGSFVDLVR